MRFVTAFALMLLLSVGLVAAEDTLFLKDGQTLTGKILSVSFNDVRFRTADEIMRVPIWAVERMERNGEEYDPSKKSDKPRSKSKKKTKPTPPPPAESPEATPAMLAWIDLCIEKLGSEDAGVRSGVGAALMAAGTTAGPALEVAADSDNGVVARDASRLLSRVRRLEQREKEHKATEATRTDRMFRALGLDEQAAARMASILGDYQMKQRDLSQSLRTGKIDVSEGPTRMTALGSERDEQLRALLNEEQMADYLKNWADGPKAR